jgi:hypothetical protein
MSAEASVPCFRDASAAARVSVVTLLILIEMGWLWAQMHARVHPEYTGGGPDFAVVIPTGFVLVATPTLYKSVSDRLS